MELLNQTAINKMNELMENGEIFIEIQYLTIFLDRWSHGTRLSQPKTLLSRLITVPKIVPWLW